MKCPGRAEIAMVLAAGAWFAIMAVYQVDDASIVYQYATNLGRAAEMLRRTGSTAAAFGSFT